MQFRRLRPKEELQFRVWARGNYEPGSAINPLWHPVVQDECQRINRENGRQWHHQPAEYHPDGRIRVPAKRYPKPEFMP
jgi:hypothetical protein